MAELQQLREEIDCLDKEIVGLYERRMEICREVAEYKLTVGKQVFDRRREEEKICSLKDMTGNRFNRQGVAELFEQIMSMSRKLQYQLLSEHGAAQELSFEETEALKHHPIVVFQGTQGAYSQAAMHGYFGTEIESFHVETFRDAMQAISDQKADFAVLPIENSSAGIVSENYDLLAEFEHYIVGEQILPIEHCLLGVPGATIEGVKTVFSHPQGLMQCAEFLDGHRDMNQVSLQNTAVAAKKVLEDHKMEQAAIASKYAGELYGLSILCETINDSRENYTRFIMVAGRPVYLKGADKVSICFEIPHESGSLYHILSHFIFNGLNLCKIESRPMKGKNWEYRFFVDFEGSLSDSAVKNALYGLKEETIHMRILGNY